MDIWRGGVNSDSLFSLGDVGGVFRFSLVFCDICVKIGRCVYILYLCDTCQYTRCYWNEYFFACILSVA